MKKGGGRLKGNGFERVIAKLILKAFCLSKKHCYRTPGSGGHRQAREEDPGDLVLSRTLAKQFSWGIECKSYKKIPIHLLLLSSKNKGLFNSWWAQAVAAAGRHKARKPLLVFKQNFGKVYCVLRRSNCTDSILALNYIKSRIDGEQVIVVMFDKFLLLAKEGKV